MTPNLENSFEVLMDSSTSVLSSKLLILYRVYDRIEMTSVRKNSCNASEKSFLRQVNVCYPVSSGEQIAKSNLGKLAKISINPIST